MTDKTAQNTTVHIPHYGAHVTVQFAYRPGMNSLDFVGDWRDLLVYLGVFAQGDESYLTFDMGKIDNQDGVLVPVPNGIPDAAELALLQYVLQHSEAEYGSYGGVSHVTAWQAYADNLEQAQTDLAGHPDYAIRAVAAYMGLGTWGHQEAMVQLIQQHLQVSLDVHLYWGSGALAPERDADTDGASNLEEWEAGPPAGGGGQQAPPGPEQQAQSYGGSSANAAVQSVIDPPPITDPEWEAASSGACTTCFVKLDVSPHDPTVEIRATPPGASSARELPKGVEVEVPVGTKIQVRILQAQDEFSHWFAPGTLINQSSWKEDDFIIAQDTVITPQYRQEDSVILKNNALGSLQFIPAGDRPVVRSVVNVNGDDLAVTVLRDTLLDLSVEPEGEAAPLIVAEVIGWEDSWTHSETVTVNPIAPDSVRVDVGTGGTSSAMLTGEHGTAGTSNDGHYNPFAETFWYLGPPETATVWDHGIAAEFTPYRGYYVEKYTGPLTGGAQGGTLEPIYLANATLTNPSPTYSAEVKDQTVITVVSECRDGCTGAYFGTVAVDPAQRFYTPSLSIDEGEMEGATFERGEIVKIWAVPSCGYYHESWKIGGKRNVYRKKLLHFPEYPYRDHMDDLEILPPGDGRYTESQLYIEPLGENIQINATFACASTVSSIEQIRFTSDHGVLHDGLENGVEVLDVTGADCPEIEWLASENRNCPITQTRNTKIAATVSLHSAEPLGSFVLIGRGSTWHLRGVGNATDNNPSVDVMMEEGEALPNRICQSEETIRWEIERPCGGQYVGTTGPHKVFVTWQTPIPAADGTPTIPRMKAIYEALGGEVEPHDGESLGTAIRDYINTGALFGPVHYAGTRWQAIQHKVEEYTCINPICLGARHKYALDCANAEVVAEACFSMAGWPANWRGQVAARPSTDVITPPSCSQNLLSNCADNEGLHYVPQPCPPGPNDVAVWNDSQTGFRIGGRADLDAAKAPEAPDWRYYAVYEKLGPIKSDCTDPEWNLQDALYKMLQEEYNVIDKGQYRQYSGTLGSPTLEGEMPGAPYLGECEGEGQNQ